MNDRLILVLCASLCVLECGYVFFRFLPPWYIFELFYWCTAPTLPTATNQNHLRDFQFIHLLKIGKDRVCMGKAVKWNVLLKKNPASGGQYQANIHTNTQNLVCELPSKGLVSLTRISFSVTLQTPAFSNGNSLNYRHADSFSCPHDSLSPALSTFLRLDAFQTTFESKSSLLFICYLDV